MPFAAAPPPAITLSPTCGSTGDAAQVSGTSWSSVQDITITFDSTPVVTVKAASVQSGKFTATFTVPARPTRSAPYQVTATEGSVGNVIATASAFFQLPCPSITLIPNCGNVGDPVGVRGVGFRADITVSITFAPPAGGTPVASVVPAPDSTFATSFKVPSSPPGTYTVAAVQPRTQQAAPAIFTIPCIKGAIQLRPTVGPPGTVVTVIGTGFPVGAAVKLSWNQGVPLSLASITIGASQGFQVTLLIFPHDELGKRTMSAGPDLSVPSAPLFNIATADFLVVQATAQPRNFSWRH